MSLYCGDALRFARVQHIGKTTVIRRLEEGIKYWLQWAFLNVGAWTDVTKGMPSYGGGDASELQVTNAPGYADGRVWQGFRTQWVHESGVTYTDVDGSGHSPLSPLVYVDSVLQSSSSYNINYNLGEVVFDSAVSTSSTVQAQHAFKNVQVFVGDEAPWWQELQFRSWNVDDDHWQLTDRGDWSVGGNHRVQLPVIIIDAHLSGTNPPYALGNYSAKRSQDVKFHIIAESKSMKDQLSDLILMQSDAKTLMLFDVDQAAADQKLPLDCNGFLVGQNFPYLVNNYYWAHARASDGYLCEMQSIHPKLHEGMVKITYSVVFSSF